MNKIGPIVKRSLPCVLTAEEKQERGHVLARLENAKTEIERNKKIAMERFKDELTATEFAIETVVRTIISGEEDREVECEWTSDWKTMTKTLTRLDTDSVVETMTIREQDRQMELQETCTDCPDPPVVKDSIGNPFCDKHKGNAEGEIVYIAKEQVPAEKAAAAGVDPDDDRKDTSHINRRRGK